MVKTLRICAAVTVIGMLAVIAPATAQFPPGPDDSTDQAQQGAPKAKRAATPTAVGPVISGSWTGQLKQVGRETPYGLELTINAKGAETKYPDLDCAGKLTRVGNSKSYAFYVEVITKGQADKGGSCPDGTITLTRQGDELALGWFASVQGNTIVAYGMLKKK